MIITNTHQSILTITMSRADKKNALTAQMYQDIANAIIAANHNPTIKSIIISGSEGVFSAGNDLADFLANPNMDKDSSVYQFLTALIDCQLPLIAAVEGIAVGVGATMLLHCDRVIASEGAVFAMPFANLGLVPEAAASLLLPRLVGYQKAAEWLLTGDQFSAANARSAGFITEVVENDSALSCANAFAAKLASKPRSSLIATKALLRRDEESLRTRLDAELTEFIKGLNGDAAKEAMTAFLEKRKPDFSNF
ncbi:MAG: enoyl-CoA hydratase [Pseudomonadales bacterium]|nr:enoyl-CoA hydratase [Pseudomonadales bacterium]